MNSDRPIYEREQPTKEFLADGNEDPQTLPQLEPSHSSDKLVATAETLEIK